MGTTPDYPILGPPRISTLGFSEVLRSNRSPAAGEALTCYRAALSAGVDPAVMLAVFRKESTFGRFGKAARTRSWGNIRDPQTSQFKVYSSWTAGAQDCARLLAIYGRNQIRPGRNTSTVQTMPFVWAPSADGNAPDGYGDSLARWIGEWQRKYPPNGAVPPPLPPATGIPTSSPAPTTIGPPWINDDAHVLTDGDLRALKAWILSNVVGDTTTMTTYLDHFFWPGPAQMGAKNYRGRTLGELRADAPGLFTPVDDKVFGGSLGDIPAALAGAAAGIVVNGTILLVVVGLAWSGLQDLLSRDPG